MRSTCLFASIVLATVPCSLPASAHGGTYRGPGDTVPPGGSGSGVGGSAGPTTGPAGPSSPNPSGPTTPGPAAPGAPGGTPGVRAVTPASPDTGPDLSVWEFWWEFNKDPYLRLKSHVHSPSPQTGSADVFLSNAKRIQGRDSLKPTEEQVWQKIVPALRQALQSETNNDIVTGCLIALAKIGDPSTESGESQLEPVIQKFLADKNQEIAETAAAALGILANPRSIETLASLLEDTARGRELVGAQEVHYRTRAFAAYGLGLIGARTGSEEDRQKIIGILGKTIQTDNTKSRDLKVSCIISMGLIPLETIESGAQPEKKDQLLPPETSRLAQLDYLLRYLQDEEQNFLVRAHCPAALARLLQGLPEEHHKAYRQRIASDLIERITNKKEKAAVVQSAILALGLMGTNDGKDPLDKQIRQVLAAVPKDIADQQARNFAMIAMAKVGGTVGASQPDSGVDDAKKLLLEQLADGKSSVRSWAGLSCGVLARKLSDAGFTSPAIPSLQQAVRSALQEEKDPSRLGAFAIACGIMGDVEATRPLVKLLEEKGLQDDARGYIAIGLGLMNSRESIETIQKIVDDSKYRPDLLKQTAIALGLLGDKDVVPKLVTLLAESKGQATQASISSALGFIGDQRSIDPLVQMLQNDQLTGGARGFAAAALGIVADKELLPWNSRIALDLNYRASTQTLTDKVAGTGVLDIL